jgi:hypothetical protein
MDHSAALSAPAGRARGIVLAGLAILGVAVAVLVAQPLVALVPSRSSVGLAWSAARTGLGEADGVVPDGVTVSVFDEETPAVGNLDPELLGPLRRAARDAAADGVGLRVNSGWRSPEYQWQLLRDAVAEYGSPEAAARWVATPARSAHVSGAAVDVAPPGAADWLSEHGASYGLCQVYRNEPWHYERRPDAVDDGCPPMYPDPTQDPRLRP